MARPTLLIEFNELSPVLLDRFIDAGNLPNFARFRSSSAVCVTTAQAEPPYLEPWIQWPTVHYGVPYRKHGASRLGDGLHIPYPGLATLLSQHGVRVGVFGSMNSNYTRLNGYFLPDPWDPRATAYPARLQPFYDFVAANVQENSKGALLAGKQLLAFGSFMLQAGVTPATIRRTIAQLIAEGRNARLKWRRATILDWLSYDVFRSLNASFGVEFATFFSNSTAHFQHYFWRNMEPALFGLPPDVNDDPSLASAILYGYQSMDALLGRFLADYDDRLLIFCTGLSQQPWTDTTKCTYRPKDLRAFLDFAGITGVVPHPVMAEEFSLECRSGDQAAGVARRLEALRCGGEPLMRAAVHGRTVNAACSVNDFDASLGAMPVTTPEGRMLWFDELLYRVTAMRSGRHHPAGCLWIRDGRYRKLREPVPLTAIAPFLLDRFGVPIPPHMDTAPLSLDRAS